MDQRSSLEHDQGTGTGPAEPGGHMRYLNIESPGG